MGLVHEKVPPQERMAKRYIVTEWGKSGAWIIRKS